jgi:hypothetical protein
MKVEFQIVGVDELQTKLQTLGPRLERKVIKKAVGDAQRFLRRHARANARALGHGRSRPGRDMSQLLGAKIVTALPKRRRPGQYTLQVQMAGGVPQFHHTSAAGKETYIPAAIEHGHMAGPTYVPPSPFLRPAADATVNARRRILADALRLGILREALKGR